MVKEDFRKYLMKNDYKESTIKSYLYAIDKISEHIAEIRKLGSFHLYKISDIERLRKIANTYGSYGNYSEFGDKGHGTYRNAINRYVEFHEIKRQEGIDRIESLNNPEPLTPVEVPIPEIKEEESGPGVAESAEKDIAIEKKINKIDKKVDLILAIMVIQAIIIAILISKI